MAPVARVEAALCHLYITAPPPAPPRAPRAASRPATSTRCSAAAREKHSHQGPQDSPLPPPPPRAAPNECHRCCRSRRKLSRLGGPSCQRRSEMSLQRGAGTQPLAPAPPASAVRGSEDSAVGWLEGRADRVDVRVKRRRAAPAVRAAELLRQQALGAWLSKAPHCLEHAPDQAPPRPAALLGSRKSTRNAHTRKPTPPSAARTC